MHRRWCHWLEATAMVLLFLLAGCSNAGNSPGVAQIGPLETGSPFPTNATTVANGASTVSFTLYGGVTGLYTIHASLPTSKLRHGYREFTIDVAHPGMSIFLAYGSAIISQQVHDWFTSPQFNSALNTITTVGEWFIGALTAAGGE